MKPKFNIDFSDVPTSEQRLEEWKLYCILHEGNEWSNPSYWIGLWLMRYGYPTLEEQLDFSEQREFTQHMMRAIDIWKYRSQLNLRSGA